MKTVAVGVGDCAWSNKPDETLVTYALGSCIAVLIHDPVAGVAGLLHFMLPNSEPGKVPERPYMYADTGIPLLFQKAYKLGAEKKRIAVAAFGGAQVMDPENTFAIGKRNHLAMRKIFWKAGVLTKLEDVGGTLSRTVKLDVATGRIQLQHGEEKKEITELMVPGKDGLNGLQRTNR